MTSITILSRIKNSEGHTVAYRVNVDRCNVKTIKASTLKKYYRYVDNAILLGTGEFRAKDGYKIKSEVYRAEIGVQKQHIDNTEGIGGDNMQNALNMSLGHEFINKCIVIRKNAAGGRLSIKLEPHKANNGASVQLFKAIEACGIETKEFIKGYLSVLQPYTLERFVTPESKKVDMSDKWWVKDNYYKSAMIIKVHDNKDKKTNGRVVVSFHESNRMGRLISGKDISSISDTSVVVITDSSKMLPNGAYEVEYTIQRGMIRFKVKSQTIYYNKGIAVVPYKDIDDRLNELVGKIMKNIEDEFNGGNALVLSDTSNKLSFISYGHTHINQICTMIDKFEHANNKERYGILAITANIVESLSDIAKGELYEALYERFGKFVNVKNKLYIDVMHRLEEDLR